MGVRKILLALTVVLALAAFPLGLITLSGASAAANDLKEISAEYNQAEQTLTVTVAEDDEGYDYAYWLKSYVDTDLNDQNQSSRQIVWKAYASFTGEGANEKALPVDEDNVVDGCYYALVRVTDGQGGLVKNYYGKFSMAEAGRLLINYVSVNGEIGSALNIAVEGEPIEIEVSASLTQGVEYTVYSGGNVLGFSDESGSFSINTLSRGSYELTVEVEKDGASDSCVIPLYVYDEYKAEEIIVVKKVSGTTDMQSGLTEFHVEFTYADGTDIADADLLTGYNISFKSENKPLVGTVCDGSCAHESHAAGALTLKYTIDYDKYGVYFIEVKTARAGLSGSDDVYRLYYGDYTRAATLTKQSGANEVTVGGDGYAEVNIDYSGSIADADGDLLYAYYREDASGWVMIKGYSADSSVAWRPSRPGLYNIQVRIKDSMTATYEKAVSETYSVLGDRMSGQLTAKIFSGAEEITLKEGAYNLAAGKPYKLVADYIYGLGEAQGNILYMYTVYSSDMGLVYLNSYNPDNSMIFVPNKGGSYQLTARAIKSTGYGYRDLAYSMNINSVVNPMDIVEIDDVEGFLKMYEGDKSTLYLLTADITFAPSDITIGESWIYAVEELSATLDGNGHKVTFSFVDTTTDTLNKKPGLFGKITQTGKVINTRFDLNTRITHDESKTNPVYSGGDNQYGALVQENYGLIADCYIKAYMYANPLENSPRPAAVGLNKGLIKSCIADLQAVISSGGREITLAMSSRENAADTNDGKIEDVVMISRSARGTNYDSDFVVGYLIRFTSNRNSSRTTNFENVRAYRGVDNFLSGTGFDITAGGTSTTHTFTAIGAGSDILEGLSGAWSKDGTTVYLCGQNIFA